MDIKTKLNAVVAAIKSWFSAEEKKVLTFVEEIEQKFLNNPHKLIPSGVKEKDFVFTAPLMKTFPPAYNYMSYLHLRDQMQEGSCTGNSTCFVAESIRNKYVTYGVNSDCSRDVQYRLAQYLTGNLGTDAGASLRGALDAGVKYGMAPEIQYPYTGKYNGTMPDQTALAACAPHKFSRYESIDLSAAKNGDYQTAISLIKTALTNGCRIVFGITVPKGMFSITGPMSTHAAQWNWADPTLNTVMGAHAIACAGYDDTLYPNGYGSCILGNSWGSAWGDNGFTAVPWIRMLNMAFECWAVYGFDGYSDVPVPPPVPQPVTQAMVDELTALGLAPLSASTYCPSYELLHRRGAADSEIAKFAGLADADLANFKAANAAMLAAWSKY